MDIKNGYDTTALMYAAKHGFKEVVYKLLAARANIDIKNIYGKTALIYATEKGKKEIVSLLLEYGAQVDLKEIFGEQQRLCMRLRTMIKR